MYLCFFVKVSAPLLFRELQQPVAEFRVGDAGGLHHLRVHGDAGEARNGVDLVEQDAARLLLDEEVDPGEPGAAERVEDLLRGLRHLVPFFRGDLGGDAQKARGVRVLGVVVVELVGGEDLSHDAGLEFVVAEDGTFDVAVFAADGKLVSNSKVEVRAGELRTISLANLDKGVYVITILKDGNAVRSFKIKK